MGRSKIQLGRPELVAEIALRHRRAKAGWEKSRLLCVKLAAEGGHHAAQIAELCGCGVARVFDWLRLTRQGGLEALLQRAKPGPKEGRWRLLADKPAVRRALEKGLAQGRWASAPQLSRWLLNEHGLQIKANTAWSWLKKLAGVLRVPRPRHPKRDDVAMAQFKENLGQRLEALGLAPGTKVKVWVMDEARFGLHTQMRRVWITKGVRPVVARQTKYEWDYLYGALEVVEGQAHFLHLPTVNLDCDALYLAHLAATDPAAVHVVIRDQAGFHLRDLDPRLPARVRIVPLPPYCPELNACEQLWDVLKDEVANHCHPSIAKLRDALLPALRRYWEDAHRVLSLVGRPWMHDPANISSPIYNYN
jgi:transposase